MRHAHTLGKTDPVLFELVSCLTKLMQEEFPQLKNAEALIKEKILKKEEERFAQTLDIGMDILR